MDRAILLAFFDLAYSIDSFVLRVPGLEVLSRDCKIDVVIRREPVSGPLSICCFYFIHYISFNHTRILRDFNTKISVKLL